MWSLLHILLFTGSPTYPQSNRRVRESRESSPLWIKLGGRRPLERTTQSLVLPDLDLALLQRSFQEPSHQLKEQSLAWRKSAGGPSLAQVVEA